MQSNTRSKLAAIKSILAGSLQPKDLREQQLYFVNILNDAYEIKLSREDEGLRLSKDEYELWKRENVRPDDVIFLMDLSKKETGYTADGKVSQTTWARLNTIDEDLRPLNETESKPQIPQEPAKEYLPQATREPFKMPVFSMPVFEPKQLNKEANRIEVKKIEAKKIIEAEPPKRRFGKLSEYGFTWECQN